MKASFKQTALTSTVSFIIFICFPVSAIARNLLNEQVDAYQKLLNEPKLTPRGLVSLLKYHDEDTVCGEVCMKFIEERIGKDGIEWTLMKEFLENTYGDAVSLDPFEPQEIHLALTDEPTEMKVIWASMENLLDPFVEYTSNMDCWDDVSTFSQPAQNYSYEVPQNWYPVFAGVLYEANMINLTPGKSNYRYRVGGFDTANNTIRRSEEFVFQSAPLTDEPDQKNTFALFGDQGTFMLLGFGTSEKLAVEQDKLGIDVVHYAGDLSYAGLSGDLTPFNNVSQDDEFGHIWDLWAIQTQPTAATRPLMTTPGNHESFYNFTAFDNRYKMPFSKSGGDHNYYFSYDYGNVHMISLNTEDSFEASSPQMQWLEQDLKTAYTNRQNVPWLILSLHRPIYCSDESQYDSHSPGGKFQTALEPWLLEYDVDLVIQGHLHAYERIHPVENGEVTVFPSEVEGVDQYSSQGKGPVYVVQGNTGAMQVEKWIYPQPEWSAIRFANGYIPPRDIRTTEGRQLWEEAQRDSNYSDTFGFGVATFHNSTHLYYSNVAVTGTIGVDEFWIVKRV